MAKKREIEVFTTEYLKKLKVAMKSLDLIKKL